MWFTMYDTAFGFDPKVGTASMPLLPILTAAGDKRKVWVPLFGGKNQDRKVGELHVGIQFTLAGATVEDMTSGGGVAAVVAENKQEPTVDVTKVDTMSELAKSFYRLAGGDEVVSLDVRRCGVLVNVWALASPQAVRHCSCSNRSL